MSAHHFNHCLIVLKVTRFMLTINAMFTDTHTHLTHPALFFRLPQIKRQDPAAAKIIRLFARSVRRFAEKRYHKRFGGG